MSGAELIYGVNIVAFGLVTSHELAGQVIFFWHSLPGAGK